ncbi:MAG: primosomal protein N' [Prevotella sp.]|nr:primosomal protein N' [Prevotella sp.]
MMYVDVILPLPLEGLFTYSVPGNLQDAVVPGMRVKVPLGKNKTYTAVVMEVHERKPEFGTKDILETCDPQPMVRPEQLKLWQWMADYYMAPLGEVYNAALPAGLKDESYHPKYETCITLTQQFRNEASLHVALNMLARSPQQQKVLVDFLAMSHYDAMEGNVCKETIVEVSRDELVNFSHCKTSTVKALVDRHILTTYQREVGRLNQGGDPHPENIRKLNAPQLEAYNGLLFQMLRKNVVLLHGVTSSGKTEIYIHLIQKALDDHKQVLYLLPEIALTVQMTQRLQRVFGHRLGIYHSKYSDAERVEIWKKQLSANPYDVVLGARSATLLPFQRLGLVIIDEEHEPSFKQQDPAPRYHARSVAIMMAAMAGAKTILGTATPSMESYHNAKTGKFGLVTLTTRYSDIELPDIQVVDIADLQRRKMMNGPFSPQLLTSVREALAKGEQAILFQNRRGFAPMVECRACGWVPKCQNCDVSLTLHKTMNTLTCHYCGYTYAVPQQCPCCEGKDLRGRGFGTEKVEDSIREIIPEARIARMDLDTTRSRSAYSRLINDFSEGRTNLLVGTQMVSKGLDFDHVSVVGILQADSILHYPDFRAAEHAFMMMAQVSGRAGRKGKRGLVLLQTKKPDHPVIQQVVEHDYEGFFQDMLEERQAFKYPPFTHIVNVFIKHRDDPVVESASILLGGYLRQWFAHRVLGPDKPVVARVKTLHIRKLVVKLETGINLSLARQYLRKAQEMLMADPRFRLIQMYYDVDPM